MPLFTLAIINVALVAAAVVQCLFRPRVFFCVTVDPEFNRTEDAQRTTGATGGRLS